MSGAGAYVYEINSINDELSRIAQRSKELRAQKKVAETRLADYMESRGLEEFQGIKLAKIRPAKRMMGKILPKPKRRAMAINILAEQGIPDAVALWEQLEEIQKARVQKRVTPL